MSSKQNVCKSSSFFSKYTFYLTPLCQRRYNDSGLMKVKFKIWMEQDGSVAFAEGRRMLLEAVDRLGSLNAAAKELGMSYRAAWGKIKATEKALGLKLLDVTTGGKGGGGAKLTDEARELVSLYNNYIQKMSLIAEKEFKLMFKQK
jgi:molybdate transport system regulatory protein